MWFWQTHMAAYLHNFDIHFDNLIAVFPACWETPALTSAQTEGHLQVFDECDHHMV